ncbi:MAG: trehalose-6-phosphate synthase [Betaproteobacteria bacterium]|nr:trehalose-6-phosphate synthase [Betaproteobacteria bacterium]
MGARARQRLVVVSNRLPFVFKRGKGGRWRIERGSGGLVSALLPVLRNRGGSWIGWPGAAETGPDLERAVTAAGAEAGFALKPVTLDARAVHEFYQGFSNEIIWPLFHGLASLCNFEPSYWSTYKEVNRKFAQVVMEDSAASDFIWVHDYHLMGVAAELRGLGCRAKAGFFLHIPFPPPDVFFILPWRLTLLHSLLQYDLLGFQTMRDRRNFIQCLRELVTDVTVQGKGQVVTVATDHRTVRVGGFPISIDYNAFMRQAATDDVARRAQELHRLLPRRKLVLGVDRLDYTKGIPHRLQAFRAALERYPDLRERMSLIQVVVPSREDIPQYHQLKTRIDQLVGQINSSYVRPGGWVPVWYVYDSLSRNDLLAYYRAADIALITPLRDGMNLVAKEYCACSIEEECVLILSEFAGAAAQLQNGALLVNPHDIEGVADTLHRAFTMSDEERRARMRRMRRSIRESDIFWWVDSFLRAAIAKDLSAFPQPESHVIEAVPDYVPI